MAINLQTVLEAIAVVGTDVPEFKQLVDEIKTTLSSDDQEVIAEAMVTSTKRADDQHEEAQGL